MEDGGRGLRDLRSWLRCCKPHFQDFSVLRFRQHPHSDEQEDANTAAPEDGDTPQDAVSQTSRRVLGTVPFACRQSSAYLRMWDCDWSRANLLSLGYLAPPMAKETWDTNILAPPPCHVRRNPVRQSTYASNGINGVAIVHQAAYHGQACLGTVRRLACPQWTERHMHR